MVSLNIIETCIMKKAVFPGSFDPITLGHYDIIHRALPLFDEIIIAVGINADKKYMFSLEERIKFIQQTFKNELKIKVTTYEGLTVEYCKSVNVDFILRGLRNPADFEFEKAIAIANRKLTGIETVFLLTSAEASFISSSIVRDIFINNGDASIFVPKSVSLNTKQVGTKRLNTNQT
jgi:pantetheine-phosphate adenylyltransferase